MLLDASGLRLMTDEADRRAPDETGGVLLGHWRGGEPVITHVLGPGPAAVHQRDAYVPDYEYHEAEIARLYAAADRVLHYLGDWHTHPGMPAYLSRRDERALRRIATYRPARLPRPVMLILGFGPRWEPGAWQGRMTALLPCRRRLVAIPLEVVVFDG